jgi:hypothetical protein
MLDPIQIPILLKAIDFVFDEGRKILEERRERRKTGAASNTTEPIPVPEPAPAPGPTEIQEPKQAKQDLLTSKIDEILWKNHEAEVQHLVRLLEKHTTSYYILKEQHAEWGSALAPPHITSQMREKESSIIETREQLERVLSKIYKKDIKPTE